MGEQPPEDGTIFFSTPKLIFGHVQRLKNASKRSKRTDAGPLLVNGAGTSLPDDALRLPLEDNTPEGLQALLAANAHYREAAWPEPFNKTRHRLHLGDARDLSWVPDASVHLVVTSPPYWTLKEYAQGNGNQMGHFEDYEHFLTELDKVWRECRRILVGGGRVCCVVGDVCIPRKKGGKHYLVPLHSDIQVRP